MSLLVNNFLSITGMCINDKQELPRSNGTQGGPDISCLPVHSSSICADWFCHRSPTILALDHITHDFHEHYCMLCFYCIAINQVVEDGAKSDSGFSYPY